jgi:diguanylate cyclase (GGDEF)-like protein
LLFALLISAVGAVGILGVRSAPRVGASITSNELTKSTTTAHLDRTMQSVYATAEQAFLVGNASQRTSLLNSLYSQLIPQVDVQLEDLERLHADDASAEHRDVQLIARQWTAVRNLLSAGLVFGSPPGVLATRLTAAYGVLNSHIDRLISKEQSDANADEARASSTSAELTWTIAAFIALGLATAAVLALAGTRRVRRAVEPGQHQIEFGETLQIARDEDEAHLLLQRHLERSLVGTAAIVLNRNNSADRLEAVTPLPASSPLAESLRGAEPHSCLAVRSGRSPLESVSQAAPVLANLRNLAIAELRAATDGLTGLPNKRSVTDTLKRMFAQASRTGTPLTLVLLDLDHFKEINDKHGHPVGDLVLANVGAVLRTALRAGDFAGRNGGEEFALLLPDTDISAGYEIAQRVRAAVGEIILPGVDVAVTVSLGMAVYPDHASTPERLERLADAALYVAKRSGRNRTELADPASEPLHGDEKTSMNGHAAVTPQPA